MKIASIVCLVLAILLAELNYWASYWLGYSETMHAFHATSPFVVLFAHFCLFSILTILVIWASILKRHPRWMLTCIIGYWPLVISTSLLTHTVCGSSQFHLLRGLRDRITHDYTLDDLRHFAGDVDRSGILNSGWINHGDISLLTDQQKEVFDQLRKKYPFMHWMDNGRFLHGPSIMGNDSIVSFEWGGALSGHWGCSISTNGSKNDFDSDTTSTILRLSDDIYLYNGD